MSPGKLTSCLSMVVLLTLSGSAGAFDFSDVTDRAEALAQSEYRSPKPVPDFLRQLGYDAFRAIRFRPDASLWRGGTTRFHVMMVPAGNVYQYPVKLHEVDSEGVHPLTFDKTLFDYPNDELAKRVPADLGYGGFKLTYPLNDPKVQNQFLTFAGASYFRGIGAGERFGLSARGIAVNTGLPSGEEFPVFREFWLERPRGGSDVMVVYGLLDGPSLAGAYRFEVRPGKALTLKVQARLFFRNDVAQPGFAPLTSMFFYGENTTRPLGQWRPQVHDSDGLLIHDAGTDEWLWRPLVNPSALQMGFHQVKELGGFGLLQRDQAFDRFEDTEARYDLRPSAWVEPDGSWGGGEVVLVEIPSESEVNDNVVAFWKPKQTTAAGDRRDLSYSLVFGRPDVPGSPLAHSARTFVGDGGVTGGGNAERAFRFVIDFKGGELAGLTPDAPVVSDVSATGNADILEHFTEYMDADHGWRLSILARPEEGKPLALRAVLQLEGKPVSETWTYLLGPESDVRKRRP